MQVKEVKLTFFYVKQIIPRCYQIFQPTSVFIKPLLDAKLTVSSCFTRNKTCM